MTIIFSTTLLISTESNASPERVKSSLNFTYFKSELLGVLEYNIIKFVT